MPEWYADFRFPILLLQSILGIFPFAYALKRRRLFRLRLPLETVAGGIILHLTRLIFFGDMSMDVNSAGRIILMIAVYLILIVICWSLYAESFWTALFVASSGYIAQDIGGTLKTLLKLFPAVNALCNDNLGILLVDTIAYIGVYAVLFLALRPFTKNREENFGNRQKAVFSFTVLIFCLGMARLAQGNAERDSVSVFAESLYQILCDIFILLLQFGVMERKRLSRSVETMRELVHQQHEQFRQSKESAALVNEKYHDLKGLLDSFHGEISQEQIDKIKKKVGEYDTYVATGNKVLDVVLAEKRAAAERRGVELTTFADGGSLAFMEDLELYSLINNALNNAIEAVCELPEGERFVTLTTSSEGGMVTIHVENPYAGEIVMENDLPKSSRDSRYHGFGMRSMERVVEKYGGTLAIKLRGGVFYLDILLFEP